MSDSNPFVPQRSDNQHPSPSQQPEYQHPYAQSSPNGTQQSAPRPDTPPQDQQYPNAQYQYQQGYPQYQQYNAPYPPSGYGYGYPQPSQQDRWNGLCIAGFILAFIIPPVGLVLSIIALVQINRTREKSKGLTIAGIVISALGTLCFVAVIAVAVWALGFTVDYIDSHPQMWQNSGDLSQLDGRLCFQDGTCVDTEDLPHDFDWSDVLEGTDWQYAPSDRIAS